MEQIPGDDLAEVAELLTCATKVHKTHTEAASQPIIEQDPSALVYPASDHHIPAETARN